MTAGKYNITIEQGSTWNCKQTFYTDSTQTTPIDFTGYSWRMQIRVSTFSEDFIIELTSDNGRIDISNQANGEITLKLTAAETAALDFYTAVYDLESVLLDTVDRKLYGSVSLSREATK